MSLTPDQVRHVALLARLGLSPEEELFYAEQLSAILAHIERISELDLDRVSPTLRGSGEPSRLRADIAGEGLGQASALANAPEVKDGYFVGPAILEAQS